MPPLHMQNKDHELISLLVLIDVNEMFGKIILVTLMILFNVHLKSNQFNHATFKININFVKSAHEQLLQTHGS